MRALIYSIIAAAFILPVPVYGNPDISVNSDIRVDRSDRDSRPWQDRINDRSVFYRGRHGDGLAQIDSKPHVHAGKPQAEVNCKYVERIDKHGERSFHFICP